MKDTRGNTVILKTFVTKAPVAPYKTDKSSSLAARRVLFRAIIQCEIYLAFGLPHQLLP